MSNIWKATVAVTAVVATAALSAPARAEFSVSFGSGGISFTYESGGYCDRWGCPDGYWDYPIYDCPIFFEGQWYDGPMYYRWYRGERWYWIRGRWHRDQWRGQRPDGMCYDEFRPALGFEFYERNGFRIRQDWRRRWHHDHDRDGGRAFDNWWNQGGRYHDWRGNDNNGRDNWFNWQGNEHRLNDWRGYDDRDRNWRGNRRHRDEGGQQFFQGGNQGGQGGNNNQGQWKQQFFQGGQGGGNQGGGNQGGQNKPNKFQGGQQFLQGGGNQGGGNQGGQNKPNKFQGGQQFFQGGQGGGNQGGGNQGGQNKPNKFQGGQQFFQGGQGGGNQGGGNQGGQNKPNNFQGKQQFFQGGQGGGNQGGGNQGGSHGGDRGGDHGNRGDSGNHKDNSIINPQKP